MTSRLRTALSRSLLMLALVLVTPSLVLAQGRGNGRGNGRGDGGDEASAQVGVAVSVATSAEVGLSVEMRTLIRDYYAARPVSNVEALPPGIRRNLARGKPLPPGIAKKTAPHELAARLPLREGYELVEVGLDVFLVEVATNVVHDVLMDVIR